VRAALAAAGLRPVAAHGLTADAEIEKHVDERRHTKAIYVATHDDGGRRWATAMRIKKLGRKVVPLVSICKGGWCPPWLGAWRAG
jgi:hypothetical protein